MLTQAWAMRTDMIKDPKMTCALGFVGNVQLWVRPDTVYLSTGTGALVTDISAIELQVRSSQNVPTCLLSPGVPLSRPR